MLGEAHVFVAGGVESMSRSPWAVPKCEKAYATGPVTMYDTTLGWRFVNPKMEALGHTDPLGITAENLAEGRHLQDAGDPPADEVAAMHRIARGDQDDFAFESHRKAVLAIDGGRFEDEIVPVPAPFNTGTSELRVDEGPRRDTTREKLAALKPAFRAGGTVTAGNSSSLNDGAAALLLVSCDYARAHGLRPFARIRSMAVAGVSPSFMGIGPVPSTSKALERAGLMLHDIGLIELNEAFAAQVLAVLRAWSLDPEDTRLNPNGGAIALGHPLGCSGARLLVTLAHQLRRTPAVQFGLATMCIGVGQGMSMIVEHVS
jgi:acetyl-CoA acetyltransferase family protein